MTLRSIALKSGTWQYYIGRSYVSFFGPAGQRFYTECHIIKGVTAQVFERGRWKQTSDGMVTPKDIARYLEGRA
jgi:hypothetical protein